jgi:DNA-binding CsgD family transcriptional regulator
MSLDASPVFLGRDHEQQVVREAIAALPGQGGTMVITGDPGIGKSMLAGFARKEAERRDLLVLTATGVPAESRLPYAGLHQLLRPVRARISDLPGPQADAILAAFGHATRQVPDRFLVDLAVTELLADAAAGQPLLVLADDAHWLDPPTCDALTFLGRRIGGEPIVMLATARSGYPMPLLDAGLDELRLDGLDEETACQLLDAVAPGLDAAVRREILDAALGNPLALTELSRSAIRAAGALGGRGFTAITDRIEKAFAARWTELPGNTRTVLLVAALNEGGTLRETLDAASMLGGSAVAAEAVTAAADAHLIEVRPEGLRFRHPLARSAIEYRAGPAQAARAHQALAAVLEGQPDRRAWHRAAATLGADEEVAAELDQAASRAVRRAAVSVGITALERAVQLSQDPAARTGRMLRAAQLSFELGRPALVQRFVQDLPAAGLTITDRARLALLEESIETRLGEGGDRIRFLAGLAREAAGHGLADLAQDLLLAAARRCWWADPGREARLLVADTAVELADSQLHPALQSVLAFAAPDAYGAMARGHLATLSHDASLDAAKLTHLGVAATVLCMFGQARGMFAAAITQLREQRRLGLLIRALTYDAFAAVYTCQWADVLTDARECIQAAADAGQHRWIAVITVPKIIVTALRGDQAEMERLASEAEPVLLSSGQGSALAHLQIGRGLSALGQGDYHTAYQHLLRLYDPADPAHNYMLCMYHIADLADAASHSGHHERAAGLLATAAGQPPGPLLTVSTAFAAAMLGKDDQHAGQRFELALAGDLRHWPFYHARLRLEYGCWLRRHHQPARSRDQLRAARGVLHALGAQGWVQRADEELRASGARAPAAAPQAQPEQLSPQERRIARLAAAGLSNREIGERLSVSHRTIGYHLYRIFPKLGITSRAELGTVLASQEAGAG